MLLGLVEQIMRGAIHRLERRVVLARFLVLDQEHVLAILAPMPRRLPERCVVDERGLDLLVVVALQLAEILEQTVEQDRAALRPEYRARRRRMHHEQIELAAEQ